MVRQQQMLPSLQHVPKSLVARAAGRRLNTGSIGADLNTSNIKIDTEGLTGLLAGLQPLVGFGQQAMVYMHGPHRRAAIAAERHGQVQQHRAVQTATETNDPGRGINNPTELRRCLRDQVVVGQGQLP